MALNEPVPTNDGLDDVTYWVTATTLFMLSALHLRRVAFPSCFCRFCNGEKLLYMNFTDAWRHDETTETLWTTPETDVAILAPHAGDIEFNTEFAAGQLHKLLRKEGYQPTTWMYHGFGENAFDEYHVSSNYLEFTQFNELSRLQDRRFRFGISFHIHEEGYVGVGGRIDEAVRSEVADRLTERLPNSKEVRYRHGEMKNKGRKESNIVNRITESGDDGLQIEMTPKTSYNYWKRVARSVRDVYVGLL